MGAPLPVGVEWAPGAGALSGLGSLPVWMASTVASPHFRSCAMPCLSRRGVVLCVYVCVHLFDDLSVCLRVCACMCMYIWRVGGSGSFTSMLLTCASSVFISVKHFVLLLLYEKCSINKI